VSFRSISLSIFLFASIQTGFSQTQDSLATAARYYKAGKEAGRQYKLDTAILFLEKARLLYARIEPGGKNEADACHALGDIYKYDLYNFDEAEKNYERALYILAKTPSSDIRNLTRLYYNLATTNRSQRDYETAVTWCLKAVDGCLKLDDSAFLERAYSIMGNIYRDMHLYDSAVVYYRKGVAVNNVINKGKHNETLAGFYNGWGDTNYRQGDLDEAAKKLSNAVAIYEKIGVSDRSIQLYTVRLLAEVYIEQNELDKAYSHLQKADELRKKLNIERGGPASALYKTFGDYYVHKKNSEKAYTYYQESLQATTTEDLEKNSEPVNLTQVEFKAFAYDAVIAKAKLLMTHDSLNVRHLAISCYATAEKLMMLGRIELETEDAKWNYIDAHYDLYENALSALHQSTDSHDQDFDDNRLHFIEVSKSKSLADALNEAELKKVIGKEDTLLSRLQKLRQQSLQIQHRVAIRNEAPDRDSLISNAKEIAAVEAVILARYPSYLETKYENSPVKLNALRARTKLLDAAFVDYFWGVDNIYAMVITGDTTGFYRLGSPAEVESSITDLVSRLNLSANQYSPEDVRAFADISNRIYNTLVKPFSELLSGKKRLVIVPDGPLMQVPFEILVTTTESNPGYNRLAYLLNDHIISYSFSGSYFANERKAPSRNPSLLAFGFTGRSDVRSGNGQEASRADIAGAETELLTLSGKFPEGTFLYGAGVTEKNFKSEAGNYDLLHLAVHGNGDTGQDYSATLYFKDAEGPEDGRLYWYELYGMNLRASLAVLSSCESGIGKTYRGEGMLSMANAFTFAGCSNIVMGLWKVDDQVSVKLMDTFYSELLEGMAIDEALALAKRTYLASADQVSANPKLWGSLVAYGEAQVVRPGELHTGWFVLAMVVLITGITLLVIKTRKK
jgi:CHAT domain-containing protein